MNTLFKMNNKEIPNKDTTILITSDYNYNEDAIFFINNKCCVVDKINKYDISDIQDNLLLKFNLYDLKTKKNLTKIEELKINIIASITASNNIIVFLNVLTYLENEFKETIIKYLKDNNKRIINYTSEIEETLLLDYLIVENKENVIMEGETKLVLKEEKILTKLGFGLPFIVELSSGLKYYEIIDKLYFDKRKSGERFMEIARILENKPTSKIYGLMGNINISTNNFNYRIVTEYKFSGTVKEYLNNNKDESSLKMVTLDSNYLNKKVEELSLSEIKKIILAKALIENKDVLVLDYFDACLNKSEKEYFKRLFKKLTKEYHKTILIFTSDLTFLWDIAEEIIIVDKYEAINSIKKQDYFKFLNLMNKPEISRFIDLMRAKGLKIDDYKETSDLLKAIYRMKENK